jgi:hypothetical protein
LTINEWSFIIELYRGEYMRKKDDEKQKSIKNAVIKLILAEGFHGTSMSKIAKEAGVSPATVYIYYENKDMMLKDIYLEYSEENFDYLLSKINKDMDGKALIETLILSYFYYIQDHKEEFHFVEQFSGCPALANQCGVKKAKCSLYSFFEEMKSKKVIKDFCNDNILAVMFSPVKEIATKHFDCEEQRSKALGEIIEIIQNAILF